MKKNSEQTKNFFSYFCFSFWRRPLPRQLQLTEERIDTNNYAIKENGCPGWRVI